jgi:hypothetical protein
MEELELELEVQEQGLANKSDHHHTFQDQIHGD